VVGQPYMPALESVLGKKVYLELHVTVSRKWRDDARFLGTLDWHRMAGRDGEYGTGNSRSLGLNTRTAMLFP
jgi:hypothetical protein